MTHLKTKTEVTGEGLAALIRREKLKYLKQFKGTVRLDIDLDELRKR